MKIMRSGLAISAISLLVAFAATPTATAAPRPGPIPKVGTCPTGYSTSFNVCRPTMGAHYAFVKTGSFCPSGYYTSWRYCVSQR